MKKLVCLIFVLLTTQNSFAQACGVYSINYIGKISSDFTFTVEKIKLPTIFYLGDFDEENSEKDFIEITLLTDEINIKLSSPLTSYLFKEADDLLKFYKKNHSKIPITIIGIQNGHRKEVTIELTWDDIQMRKINHDDFGNLFELNLNEILIK